MVLSTIHTNDSVSAVTRLLDLGVPGFLLSATLRGGVLSQRLMPVNCVACNGAGCAQCGETGRAGGRQVVSELLEVGPGGLAQAITEGGVPLAELERVAQGGEGGFCRMGG